MAEETKKTNIFLRYTKFFWKAYFFGFLGILAYFFLTSLGILGDMPSFEELENPDANLATEIYSADNKLMGKFYKENRSPIDYNDLPKHLVEAVIATEDERFFEHSGIDARAVMRAIRGMGSQGGGSTITQQLAKLLFHGERSKNKLKGLHQKVKEWIIAIRLEKQYTKNEIIAMYLNRADFVNHAVGIRSAARTYFGKEPRELTIEESALFAGMLQNPSLYNPARDSRIPLCIKRRNEVYLKMVRNNIIDQATKDKLTAKPIVLDFKTEDHVSGIAPYFREYLREYMKEWVKTHKKPDGSDYDIYGDGLKIYTTLDSRMQTYAEEAVEKHMINMQRQFFSSKQGSSKAPFHGVTQKEFDAIIDKSMRKSERWRLMKSEGKSEEAIIKSFGVKTKMTVFTWKGEKDTLLTPMDSMKYYKHFLNTGLVSMEPQKGHVKAWVGGINFKHFKYDHAGLAKRQVGSSFKPFVYAAAIEQLNMSPCDTISGRLHTIPRGRHNVVQSWTPKNSGGGYPSLVTLEKALAQSLNTVSARLIDRVGPKAVIDFCNRLGIKENFPETPAICLGSQEISCFDMVSAFCTFPNHGIYTKPQLIARIVDKRGNVVFEAIPESQDAISQDVAYATLKLMEGVTEDGTSKRLRDGYGGVATYDYRFKNTISGKTGTTQNNSDGWFMGIVPNLVTGVWVGGEDRAARFANTGLGQGATMALPIWGIYMHKCYQNKELQISTDDFEEPLNLTIRVDCKNRVSDTTKYSQNLNEFNF